MRDPAPLTAEEQNWLQASPPTDALGRRVAWTLEDRKIEEAEWTLSIEHEALTLRRVDFRAAHLRGGVFRRCVFQDVRFERAILAQVRFEDVVFEQCTFDSSILDSCHLERCRFEGNHLRFLKVLRTPLLHCELAGTAVTVLDLRECLLSGSTVRDSTLQGLRATRVSADDLRLSGGELRGGDLTLCELGELRLSAVRVEGLRVVDCKLKTMAFSGARVSGLEVSGSTLETLSIHESPEVLALRILSCRLTELRIESCPMVHSPLLSDTTLERVLTREATLFDGAFERVVVGQGSRLEGGELAGVFFNEGRWESLALVGIQVSSYVAVTGTRFRWLRLNAVRASPELDLRLTGDVYGPGSWGWRDVHGPRPV